jgi:hypothetical protein
MAYLLLATIAAFGFVASLACHILSWWQITPPGGNSVFILHVGFLILWFPLIIFANRTTPKGANGNLNHLFAEMPLWVLTAGKILIAYIILNFVYFMYCTSQYPNHKPPLYVEVRGFSGHWMLFYGIATIGFIALARLAQKQKQN